MRAVEKKFELNISNLDLPLVGVIDLVAEVDETEKVIDFKTSDKSYGPADVVLSDQLTTYQLSEPQVDELALCILLKTSEPRVEWHPTKRDSVRLTEFLDKAGYVAREIKTGQFYKRTGIHCSWCDFLPVCLGDKKKAEETLVQIK